MELQNIFDFIPDTHYNYEKVFPQGYRIRLFECFAGVGMTRMAFNRLQIPYESVGISEIDKYALKSYEAIHGDCNNYGDITKLETLPPCDILTWSFPCTDLSKAGKQAGMVEGTRSNFGWEIIRLVRESNHKPTVLIMENVVDLVQEKFARDFWEMRVALERIGYKNRYQVLNAKDYGVAQNRERVFMVSILGDWYYEFPVRMKLEKRLRDYLEEKVDEKYYLSQKLIDAFENHKNRHSIAGNGFGWKLKSGEEVATTLKAAANTRPDDNFIAEPTIIQKSRGFNDGGQFEICPSITANAWQENNKVAEPNKMKEMIDEAGNVKRYIGSDVVDQFEDGDCADLSFPNGYNKAKRVTSGYSQAITCATVKNLVTKNQLRIRKLTPIECWRLMGIDDTDFHKAQAVVSNSQLYKQAGNGLVVDVFAGILKGLAEEPRKGKE